MSEPATQEVKVEELSVEPAKKATGSWGAVIAVIVIMPMLSYAMTVYVLLPKLKEAIAAQASGSDATRSTVGKSSSQPISKAGEPRQNTLPYSASFQDVVVNLSGAKGTRYLKVSFTIMSSSPDLEDRISRQRNELQDLVLGILSSKTLADLEIGGSKNLLRHDLIENFNRVLKGNIVEQIYFTDFVVQ